VSLRRGIRHRVAETGEYQLLVEHLVAPLNAEGELCLEGPLELGDKHHIIRFDHGDQMQELSRLKD
jgi:hypothetical protein